jgi:hypothetical protein
MSDQGKDSVAHDDFSSVEALSPFKADAWRKLTPKERLARSWAMRARLRDPQAVHDAKLFPKP